MTENIQEQKRPIFLPRGLEDVVMPLSFIRGSLAKVVYPEYLRIKTERFKKNIHFQLQLQDGELIGSTLHDVALIDEIVRKYGGRVLLPSDLHNDMTVPDIIKGKHYVDRFGLILRGNKAELYDERGRNIAEALESRDEIDTARLQEEPALVTDLKVVPAEGGYGFVFQPREKKLRVVYSDKFNQRYDGKRFNGFDENGVPTNFSDRGIFRNYIGEKPPRVSRFDLNWDWDSVSDWDGFGYSGAYGRVVVTADEVGALKISDVLEASQRSELLDRLNNTAKYLSGLADQLRQD